MALELEEPMTARIGKRELLLDDEGIGRGTIIEQQLWRPLHRARVSSLEIKPDVALRDWSQFCPLVAASLRHSRQSTSLAELLLEAGVGAIVARVTPRPELFEVGAPPAPMQVVVDRERTRQSLLPASGPAQHLYPPDKGWVRLDPTVRYETISLLDLTVLINEPAELASMLTRLIDEDASDDSARAAALQHRYSDVVMLIGALDARLARILFSKLSRAVLSLYDARFAPGDVLVFGCETAGLPQSILDQFGEDRRLAIPMRPGVRSLNLSNAVAVSVYEAWRQQGFAMPAEAL